jgi:adenine-specific DNA-methyltransferase
MQKQDILKQLDQLNEQQLRRLLAEHLTSRKLGLVWEADLIARDQAVNANIVLPKLIAESSCLPENSQHASQNLIIEGDNYDALRLLRTTHRGKIRVIYIDPPYNTGNKDWVYNDRFVSSTDKYRHSQWLEFLYRRLVLARDLLTPDGVIMVSINDENRSKLELLMDEVFPNRRLGSLVWRTRDSTSAKSANFSDVHEHILIYAGEGFSFTGRNKTQKKYKNPDNDPRGPWNGDPLTLAFDRFDRKNLYYPIYNPQTDTWYPCDENSVWRYASEKNLKDGATVRTETIEEFIKQDKILFPQNEVVKIWISMDELLADIDAGNIPVTPKRKRPLLSRDTPDLDFWLNKKVGFGRPLFKKHWKDLQSHTNPLSSWISRLTEEQDDEDVVSIRSPQAGEGSELIQELFGAKVFQYPKPVTLIKELIHQASKPNDIVLDFFAGSGTTAHAVLALNNEDGGNRQFILCSSTEATAKEPDKNLCRDVCSERVRSVINGKNTQKALGGSFAYLQLDLLQSADALFELTPEHATLMLRLREAQAAGVENNEEVIAIASNDTLAVLVCPVVSKTAIKQLLAYPCERVAVYSDRPDTVEAAFIKAGRVANSYNLADSLIRTQKQVSGK